MGNEDGYIEYSRIFVPPSMRSLYWRYFGFPADNDNNILTKQKIICRLCNTVIAYNKNTSNLRTHMISRHPEYLHKIFFHGGTTETVQCGVAGPTNAAKGCAGRKVNASSRKRRHTNDMNVIIAVEGVGATLPSIAQKIHPLPGNSTTAYHAEGYHKPHSSQADNLIGVVVQDQQQVPMDEQDHEEQQVVEEAEAVVEEEEEEDDEEEGNLNLESKCLTVACASGMKADICHSNHINDEEYATVLTDSTTTTTVIEPQNDHHVDHHVDHDVDADADNGANGDADDDADGDGDGDGDGDVDGDGVLDDEHEHCYADADADSKSNVLQPYTFVDVVPQYDKALKTLVHPASPVKLMAEMVITDLLTIDTVFGQGFQQLIAQHFGKVKESALIEELHNRHVCMRLTICAYLENFSQRSPYALSIESYTNVENVEVFSVYVNLIGNAIGEQRELQNVLYQTAMRRDFDLKSILQNFNLGNCAAVVLSASDDHIKDFAQGNGIPIVVCLDAVLTRCLEQVFSVAIIASAFDEINKMIDGNHATLFNLPQLYGNCPWSKLNYLEYILDHLLLNDLEDVEILAEMRAFFEYINALKITLETIAEETSPLCTLTRPLIVKLFEDYFSVTTTHTTTNKYIKAAKVIIAHVLQDSIIRDTFLLEATFFDARFQHGFIDDKHHQDQPDRAVIQESIGRRFKQLIEETEIERTAIMKWEDDSGKTARRSSLKSFFNRCISDATLTANAHYGAKNKSLLLHARRTNIDTEFDKYKCEPTLDLELCPISWWYEHAHIYLQLQKIAIYYLCIPCCVNRLFRLDANERARIEKNRFALRQQSVDGYLWFLHYNKSFYEAF